MTLPRLHLSSLSLSSSLAIGSKPVGVRCLLYHLLPVASPTLSWYNSRRYTNAVKTLHPLRRFFWHMSHSVKTITKTRHFRLHYLTGRRPPVGCVHIADRGILTVGGRGYSPRPTTQTETGPPVQVYKFYYTVLFTLKFFSYCIFIRRVGLPRVWEW